MLRKYYDSIDSTELQRLIRRMANENITWGEERIANELLLKLGIAVSPRTVRKIHAKALKSLRTAW